VNRKKLAVWVAAGSLAAVPLAVQAAEMEVYGEAHLSVDFLDNKAASTDGKEDSALTVSSNTSKLGFKGSERLSDNLSAVWQYESEVELDEGDIAIKGRDSYAGLEGSWGLLKAGRLSTPMKSASSKIDIFTNSRADHNLIVGSVNGVKDFDSRLNNTIWYSTPKMAGIKLNLSYTPETGEDALPNKLITPKESVTGISLNYDKGPLYLALSAERKNDAKLKDDRQYSDIAATQLVGRWDFGQGTKVALVYEDAESSESASYQTTIDSPVTIVDGALATTKTLISNAAADGEARAAFYLNIAHKVGNTTWKAAYGQADDLDNSPGTGAKHYALSFYQSYSKDTQLYVIYTMTDNDANASYGLKDMRGIEGKAFSALSFGIKKRFSTR